MGPQINQRLTGGATGRFTPANWQWSALSTAVAPVHTDLASQRPPSRVFQLTCKRHAGSIQEKHVLLLDLLEIRPCYSWTVFYCTIFIKKKKKRNSNGLQQTRITSAKVTWPRLRLWGKFFPSNTVQAFCFILILMCSLMEGWVKGLTSLQTQKQETPPSFKCLNCHRKTKQK